MAIEYNSKYHGKLPPQQLPMSKKTREWRKAHLDWAESKTFFNWNPVRNSTIHKKINYDLIQGKLHMDDLLNIINPERVDEGQNPEEIQHYPIINNKLNVLRGEESKRVFDYRVIVTNPNSVSEIENTKRDMLFAQLQQLVADQSLSNEDYEKRLQEMSDFFTYQWQDIREVRANNLLNHYIKEYNIPALFNAGFMDAMIVGEEIYQCDIRGGEPIIERVNPLNIRVFRSGYESEIEKADVIIIEDYWSPGKIIDSYYDSLSKKDIDYIESIQSAGDSNPDGTRDERMGFINAEHMIDDHIGGDQFYFDPFNLFSDTNSLSPFDTAGNIRVIRMYWKSRRRIKKVKSYDPETGKETYNFYTENYVLNKELGEEEDIYYINEAWEGTKIGKDIYINMRPRVIQYNRLSSPSRCHFGIIGSIYNLNNSFPYSLVDIMKPYSYLYDVVHDRLNKMLARNWGKIVLLDLAKVPKGWTIDKWWHYAKHNNLAVIDSFKEGDYGAATGKLAGGLNNANNGVIDAELGNSIQQYLNILEYIKAEMTDVSGVSKQREGQIANRETVGGVERATLQSSHITEWLFITHDDVKRRALECFLETAKIALKGQSMKFSYILSDGSQKIADIDGDEFAENDYGLVVDSSDGLQQLQQRLDGLAQAGLQNQLLNFSTMMKMYTTVSVAEKIRLVENAERETQQRVQEQQQQELQAQQQQAQAELQFKQLELEQADAINQRDNETKLIIANINSQSKEINDGVMESPLDREKLMEQMREFDAKLNLDKERLALDKHKAETDASIKREALKRKTTKTQ